MSVELALLQLLSYNKDFNRFHRFVKKEHVTKETWMIVDALPDWYATHTEVDWEDFGVWFKMFKHPSLSTEKLEIFDHIFKKAESYTHTATEEEVLHSLLARDFAEHISVIVTEIADGTRSADDLDLVEDLYREYRSEIGYSSSIDDMVVDTTLSTVLDAVSRKDGLEWRLKELNLALGPLAKGDFICVGARPNTGKTSLLASEITHFASQVEEGEVVIIFSNEEKGDRWAARCMSAHFGVGIEDIEKDIKSYEKRWEDEMQERLIILHSKSLHIRDVEDVLHEYGGRTRVVVIDMLMNMHGFEKVSNEVSRMGAMFRWGRETADNVPISTAHQLKGEAQGVLYPGDNMYYGSTTLLPGTCDAMISLGKEDPLTGSYHTNTRGLWVPKNKLPGKHGLAGKYTDAKFLVEINPITGRLSGK